MRKNDRGRKKVKRIEMEVDRKKERNLQNKSKRQKKNFKYSTLEGKTKRIYRVNFQGVKI